jgi:small subunit ribosomal protein S17
LASGLKEGYAVDARGTRKMRIGRVVSDSMDNTVVVAVERIVAHPLYGRRMKRTQRFMAHNEDNQARVGDRVRLMETRPLSKRKRWRVVEILERAK